MGKLSYEQLKEMLIESLDTVDRYNRIIRQLLSEMEEEDTSKDTPEDKVYPIEEVKVEKPVKVIGEVTQEDVNFIYVEEPKEEIKEEKTDGEERSNVEIENVKQQLNKVQTQLELNLTDEEEVDTRPFLNPIKVVPEPIRVEITSAKSMSYEDQVKTAEEYLNMYTRNDPERKNKPGIIKLYNGYQAYCRGKNIQPMGRFSFEEVVEKFYPGKSGKKIQDKIERQPKAKPVKKEYKFGDGVYDITLDNIDSIKPRLQVGDVINLHHSTYGVIPFEVAGKNIDGANLVTLISKDCVTTKKFGGNSIVYRESEIRNWLNEVFVMGFDIADKIEPVEKKTLSDYDHARLVKSTELCWIPSRHEVMIDEMSADDLVENNRYPLFSESKSRIKKHNGLAESYLLRSAIKPDKYSKSYDNIYSKSNYVARVNKNGQLQPAGITREYGIVVGLCI